MIHNHLEVSLFLDFSWLDWLQQRKEWSNEYSICHNPWCRSITGERTFSLSAFSFFIDAFIDAGKKSSGLPGPSHLADLTSTMKPFLRSSARSHWNDANVRDLASKI